MAALSAAPATLYLGFRRPGSGAAPALRTSPKSPPARLSSRLGNALGLHVKHRVPTVFASDNHPSNSDAGKGKVDMSSSGVADGPPLLTILAGIAVFLLVCWFIGSVVMWLISLIVNVPPS